MESTVPPPATVTAPPPSIYSRTMHRERVDRATMHSFGQRREHRAHRKNGDGSAWDSLEKRVVHAATTLWELAPQSTPLTEDLAAYCAFLAWELELNESMDLAPSEDATRLRMLAPRALDALDAISAPFLTEAAEANPVTRALAHAFGAIRAELFVASGMSLLTNPIPTPLAA